MEPITTLLPHRDPFLFVDEIIKKDNHSITTRYLVKENTVFFKGHYPGKPVMPGVLLCEAMFQTGALLMASEKKLINLIPVVTRANHIRFRKIVKPGDMLTIESELTETIGEAYCFSGKIRMKEKLVASCEFICTLVREE